MSRKHDASVVLGARIRSIRIAYASLNKTEDWAKRRESALESRGGSSLALLILQKIIMNSVDEKPELQLAMIRAAFNAWEAQALAGEVYLWQNVDSYAYDSSPHLKRESERCQALLKLRNLIKGDFADA